MNTNTDIFHKIISFFYYYIIQYPTEIQYGDITQHHPHSKYKTVRFTISNFCFDKIKLTQPYVIVITEVMIIINIYDGGKQMKSNQQDSKHITLGKNNSYFHISKLGEKGKIQVTHNSNNGMIGLKWQFDPGTYNNIVLDLQTFFLKSANLEKDIDFETLYQHCVNEKLRPAPYNGVMRLELRSPIAMTRRTGKTGKNLYLLNGHPSGSFEKQHQLQDQQVVRESRRRTGKTGKNLYLLNGHPSGSFEKQHQLQDQQVVRESRRRARKRRARKRRARNRVVNLISSKCTHQMRQIATRPRSRVWPMPCSPRRNRSISRSPTWLIPSIM